MRKNTKLAISILSLGVLGTSWSIGQAAETGLTLGGTSTTTDAAASPTPTAAQTDGPAAASPTPSDSASSSASATPKATASATPKATKTATPTGKSGTKTGDPIDYRYGTIQVKVTEKNSAISDVTLVQAGATNGREQIFPALVNAAIKANGSNFGNASGATMTINAFKQALDSALAKF
ncbi:MAG: FMN-binding protein [Rhodoluna sp.]